MASDKNSDSLESNPDEFGVYPQLKTRMARRKEAEKCGLDVDLVVSATEKDDVEAIERLLEELEKASDKTVALLKTGKKQPVRAHGHVPESLINDLLAEILYQFRDQSRVPSILLCRMIERQLDTGKHGLQNIRQPREWMEAAKILRDDPGKSSREVAKLVDVNPKTVSRWKKDELFKSQIESPRGYPPVKLRF
jgi:hypothetical protein